MLFYVKGSLISLLLCCEKLSCWQKFLRWENVAYFKVNNVDSKRHLLGVMGIGLNVTIDNRNLTVRLKKREDDTATNRRLCNGLFYAGKSVKSCKQYK